MTTPTTQRVPRVGEVAPDFTLPSTSGEPVTLSSYRGESEVLIAFFTLALSEVCTAQMCEFRDDFDREGIVGWAHVEEHPGKRRDSEEPLEQLAALG